MDHKAGAARKFDRAGFILGFGLGGFLDGILLHQILQWHHLLSLVPGVDRLDTQILWDGLFHIMMYMVVAAGLIVLARSGAAFSRAGSGRRLFANLLIGIGAWNVVDVGLFHWILEIHHIRVDTPNPIAWDTGWLLAFGAVPLLLGWRLRTSDSGGSGRSGHGYGAAVSIALVVVGAGIWAAKPPPASRDALVVFMPGMTEGEKINAVLASGALPLGQQRGVWMIRWGNGESALRLYGNGALLVGSGWVGGGCLGWSQAAGMRDIT